MTFVLPIINPLLPHPSKKNRSNKPLKKKMTRIFDVPISNRPKLFKKKKKRPITRKKN